MRVPRRHLATAAVLTAVFVCLLVGLAAGVLAAENTGAQRAAWGLICAAAALCAASSAAALLALPSIRRSLQYGRRSRQQVAELAAHHRRVAASVERIRGHLEGKESKSSLRSIDEKLATVISQLERVPDTARTHKLLEVTSQKTIQAVTDSSKSQRNEIAATRKEIAATRQEMSTSTAEQTRRLSAQTQHLYGQIDGLAALYSSLRPGTALPPLYTDWAIGADLAAHIVRHVLRERPNVIVEVGSGISTVLMAMAARQVGHGHVLSLEHDPTYADKTSQLLRMYEVEDWASVEVAPLTPTEVEGDTYMWYDLGHITVPDDIDVLVVDGPPGNTGPHARFPAVPRLRRQLADQGVVFLDDARRPEEAEIVERWCASYGLRLAAKIRFTSGTAELVPAEPEGDADDGSDPVDHLRTVG